jgi:HD-GYP domain-containing protein (c-di-GMP phosphodiesterase class II)
VKDINYTSVLHDIGKMAIPSAILEKDGSLTQKSWR